MHNRRSLSRRQMLRLSAGTLLGAGLWPGALLADGAGSPGDFSFVVINDIHYLDNHCGQWLEGVRRQIKGHDVKVELCLIVGDLAEHGKTVELAPVRDIFKDLGMPVHEVIGNHDYQGPEDRKAFEDLYPGRLNYHFEFRGWQFVGLDTTEGQHSQKTSIQAPTLRWLDETLPKLDSKRPMVLFTHFPLGPRVTNRPLNADDVLERFRNHNLQTVFNGHFHGYTERRVGEVTLTTNRCCSFSRANHDGTKEKGYFLCSAKDGKIRRNFVEVKTA